MVVAGESGLRRPGNLRAGRLVREFAEPEPDRGYLTGWCPPQSERDEGRGGRSNHYLRRLFR